MRLRRTILLCLVAGVAIGSSSDVDAQVFHGVVLDTESRQPVWVAAVSLVDMENRVRRAAVTDSAGRYEITAPGPGRYKLRVDPRGYRHAYSGEYIVQAGDTVEVNFLVTYEPESPAPQLARARGVVTWAPAMRREVGWSQLMRGE